MMQIWTTDTDQRQCQKKELNLKGLKWIKTYFDIHRLAKSKEYVKYKQYCEI